MQTRLAKRRAEQRVADLFVDEVLPLLLQTPRHFLDQRFVCACLKLSKRVQLCVNRSLLVDMVVTVGPQQAAAFAAWLPRNAHLLRELTLQLPTVPPDEEWEADGDRDPNYVPERIAHHRLVEEPEAKIASAMQAANLFPSFGIGLRGLTIFDGSGEASLAVWRQLKPGLRVLSQIFYSERDMPYLPAFAAELQRLTNLVVLDLGLSWQVSQPYLTGAKRLNPLLPALAGMSQLKALELSLVSAVQADLAHLPPSLTSLSITFRELVPASAPLGGVLGRLTGLQSCQLLVNETMTHDDGCVLHRGDALPASLSILALGCMASVEPLAGLTQLRKLILPSVAAAAAGELSCLTGLTCLSALELGHSLKRDSATSRSYDAAEAGAPTWRLLPGLGKLSLSLSRKTLPASVANGLSRVSGLACLELRELAAPPLALAGVLGRLSGLTWLALHDFRAELPPPEAEAQAVAAEQRGGSSTQAAADGGGGSTTPTAAAAPPLASEPGAAAAQQPQLPMAPLANALAALPQLAELSLQRVGLGAAAAQLRHAVSAQLTQLQLRECSLTDAALGELVLGQLRSLRALDVSLNSQLTRAAAPAIAQLMQLTSLNIEHTAVAAEPPQPQQLAPQQAAQELGQEQGQEQAQAMGLAALATLPRLRSLRVGWAHKAAARALGLPLATD